MVSDDLQLWCICYCLCMRKKYDATTFLRFGFVTCATASYLSILC